MPRLDGGVEPTDRATGPISDQVHPTRSLRYAAAMPVAATTANMAAIPAVPAVG